MGSSLQDALLANKDVIEANISGAVVTGAETNGASTTNGVPSGDDQEATTEVVVMPSSFDELDIDELDIDAILASLSAATQGLAERDEEIQRAIQEQAAREVTEQREAEQREAAKSLARTRLAELYSATSRLQSMLENANKVGMVGVKQAQETMAMSLRGVKILEEKYPELKREIQGSFSRQVAAREVITRFVRDDTGYATKGTPNPTAATVKEATSFLAGVVKQVATGKDGLLRPREGDEKATLVTADGSWVSKYPEIVEITEMCAVFTDYRIAVEKADRQRLENWAAGLVNSNPAFLLTPDMVDTMKGKEQEGFRRNIRDAFERPGGYVFMPVNTRMRCDVTSYMGVRVPEVLVRIWPAQATGGKKYVIRFDRATVPQIVSEVFGKGPIYHPVTVKFDGLDELVAAKSGIPEVLRNALVSALSFADRQRKEQADLAVIRDVATLGDGWVTVEDISKGEAGIAVVSIPSYVEYDEKAKRDRKYPLGMQMVSDGTTVKPGLATLRSKEGWMYKTLAKDGGMKVRDMFVRGKDGALSNAKLQDVFVRNESGFEMNHLMDAAGMEHKAQRISAKNGNVSGLCFMQADGGRDGTYVGSVIVFDKKPHHMTKMGRQQTRENGREAAYVMTRSGDTITFVAGLTAYSCAKFEASGLKFGEVYAINALTDYARYVVRTLYCAVTATARDKVPAYLLAKIG